MSDSSLSKFLGGAILGGLLGGIIGVLMAPRAGSETRNLLRSEFDHRYSDSRDALHQGQEKLKEKSDRLQEKATEISSDLKHKVQDTVSDLTDTLEEKSKQVFNKIRETTSKVAD
jgi:gas vesicle protein